MLLDGLGGLGVVVLVALTALGLLAFLVASDCVEGGWGREDLGVGRSVVEGRDAFKAGKEDKKRNRTRRECVAECVCVCVTDERWKRGWVVASGRGRGSTALHHHNERLGE